jgi:hypothetical protein
MSADDGRKIVQIATSVTTSEYGTEESLYALDSCGEIYFWTYGDIHHSRGWSRLELPWELKSKPTSKEKKRE